MTKTKEPKRHMIQFNTEKKIGETIKSQGKKFKVIERVKDLNLYILNRAKNDKKEQ